MRGAIIGFGFIAEGHLWAYSSLKTISIVAVVDTCKERLSRAAELINDVHCYTSFEELVANERIDFVDVCTPPYCRFNYMRKALEAHLDVIGEKPFLLDYSQYEVLCDLAQKNRLVLYPSHNYLFAPALAEVKKYIDDGGIGQLISAHFRTLRIGHAKGCTEWNENWRRFSQLSGGGIIQDHGPHSIYTICNFLNEWPHSVSCVSGCMNRTQAFNTEDTAWLTMYFNASQVDLDLSWASSRRDTKYSLYGTKGSVIINNDTIVYVTNNSINSNKVSSEFDDPSHKKWFVQVIKDFESSVINKRFRWDLLKASYMTVAVIDAAYNSSLFDGRIVSVHSFPDCMKTH